MTMIEGIRKTLAAAIFATAAAALLVVSTGTASAQEPEVHEMTRAYCQWYSSGRQEFFEDCLKKAAETDKRLSGIGIEPDEEEFCREASLGDYLKYEECIKNVTSPGKRQKRKKLKEDRKKREKLRDRMRDFRQGRKPIRNNTR